MTIAVGDTLPSATFRVMTDEGPAARTTEESSRAARSCCSPCPAPSRRPATRTTCRAILANYDAIKAKGVDAIAVTGVNDVFVMDAWAKSTGGAGKIEFLADGNGDFAKALGLAMDGSGFGLGTRSQRYSMVVEDGVVPR